MGAGVTFTDSVLGGNWSASGPLIIDAGGAATGMANGSAVIVYKLLNSCGADSTRLYTYVDTVLKPSINGIDILCLGKTDTLSVSPNTGSWFIQNNGLQFVVSNILIADSAGSDTLVYTCANICGGRSVYFPVYVYTKAQCDSVNYINDPVGTQPLHVIVYPNPSYGKFTLQLPIDGKGCDVSFTVTDITGKAIYEREISNPNKKLPIDLTNMPPGTYILKTILDRVVYYNKLVVW